MAVSRQRTSRIRSVSVALAFACASICLAEAPELLDAVESAERAEGARIALIERISPAVVCIFDEDERGGGSGVLIDEAGYGLTNFHVVASMLESRRGLGGLPDGKLYDLEVLGIDPGGDVAMFRLTGRDRFPHVRLGDSDSVRVGDGVLAAGNPFMLSSDYKPSVSMGIVSGVNRYQYGAGGGDTLLYSDCIQVDAAINPGNSGGPLFDFAGEVIGINGRISTTDRGRYNVGLGYAITTRQIEPILPALRAGLLVEHGTIRAVVSDLPERGVVFTEIRRDGPAWSVGIRPGDALLRFDGRQVDSANTFASILGTLPANWPVAISYRNARGDVVHRITRTDPVETAASAHFKADAALNLKETYRTVTQFLGEDAAWSSDGAVQMRATLERGSVPGSISFELSRSNGEPITLAGTPTLSPTEETLLEQLSDTLNNVLLKATKPADLAYFSHTGADRILRIDETDGRILESRTLESIRTTVSESSVIDYQFDAQTHKLARIIATDQPTGDTVTITFDAPAAASIDAEKPEQASERYAAIDYATQRVVKLTGAKVGRSEGYASGIIVSEDGLVLTVDAGLLDASNLLAVLPDGTHRSLEQVHIDRQKQLALLRIERDGEAEKKETFAHFDLEDAPATVEGQFVLAAGNPFKVASGAERVSVAQGVLGGRIRLDALRRNEPFSYTGDVLVLDAITSTPGFAGGALADADGRLLGMIGRVVEARSTHTMLNYAVPRDVLARFVRDALDPATGAEDATDTAPAAEVYHGIKFFELGYMSNPVYVERVRRGSPAARAGLRKDDLIIGANSQPVPKLEALERIIGACRPGDTLELAVLRNEKVQKIDVVLEGSEAGSAVRTHPAPAESPTQPTNTAAPLHADPVTTGTEALFRSAAESAAPYVVQIETVGGVQPRTNQSPSANSNDGEDNDDRFSEELGSSFLLADGPTTGIVYSPDGYILTSSFNFVRDPSIVTVKLPDGRQLPAEIVARDHVRKLALLKIDADNLPTPTWTPREQIRTGEWAVALGRGQGDNTTTLSAGITSAVSRMAENAIQTDAKLSPANYGGPLLDSAGRVLGVCVPMGQYPGELAGIEFYDAGIGFAVPGWRVREIVAELKEGHSFQRGWLGFVFDPQVTKGVRILQTGDPSPIRDAGALPGDYVVEVNGQPIKHYGQLVSALYMRPAGESVRVRLLRGADHIEVEVTLAARDEIGPLSEVEEPFDPTAPKNQQPAPDHD